jgi:hypothetical protein
MSVAGHKLTLLSQAPLITSNAPALGEVVAIAAASLSRRETRLYARFRIPAACPMSDLKLFLQNLSLEKYLDVLASRDIDLTVALELTEQDLEKLGLSLGHRRKFMAAAAKLRAGMPFIRARVSAPRSAGSNAFLRGDGPQASEKLDCCGTVLSVEAHHWRSDRDKAAKTKVPRRAGWGHHARRG